MPGTDDLVDPMHIDQHISARYNAELEDVRSKALAMGGLVDQ